MFDRIHMIVAMSLGLPCELGSFRENDLHDILCLSNYFHLHYARLLLSRIIFEPGGPGVVGWSKSIG